MKFVEIGYDVDSYFVSDLYEDLKNNRELIFMDRLDFEKLLKMEQYREDSIERLDNDVRLEMIFDYIAKFDVDYVIEYKKDNDITVLNKQDKIDIVEEYINCGYLNESEHFKKFAEMFNLSFDTVGYSPWSYYIALPDLDYNYILDLYEGNNFYSVIIYEDNENGELEYYDDTVIYYGGFEFDDFNKMIEDWIQEDYLIMRNGTTVMMDIEEDKLVTVERKTVMKIVKENK